MAYKRPRKIRKLKQTKREKRAGLHTIRRAKQRYKLDLTRNDLARMASLVKRRQGCCIERISLTRSVWLISFKGCEELVVLYDKSRKIIETVLPKDCDEMKRFKARNPQN